MFTDKIYGYEDIVGACIYWVDSYINDGVLIIWNTYGELFQVDLYYMILISEINMIDDDSIFLGYFVTHNHSIYNEILTRIEDLYGMSIEEFSLGKLEYI